MNSKNKKLLSKIIDNQKQTSLSKIKKRKRRELTFIIGLFSVVILFIAFMFSPYVKLKNIEVSGYSQISKEEILEAGGINTNLKTWSIKDTDVEKKIKDKYNILKNVSVKSKMLSSIVISVEEYKLIAQNKLEDGNYQAIMENGDVYSGKIRNNYNLPILEKFKDDNGKLREIYKNLSELKTEVLSQISEIINDKDNTIIIYMKDGQKVKALSSSFAEKLNYYDEISKYIKDKNKTTLNLINGTYLETEKTDKEKSKKINALLNKSGVGNQNNKNNVVSDESTNKEQKNQTSEKNLNNSQKQKSATTQKKRNTP
ncbi:cell division protein FtsQ/DivIB [Gemella cuniculi]|uniref:cell division protein FtsQ/DivIB n=1 Tax=Gemella cuniculi TaxID=150240 RepID=UPI000418E37E|nr:FtsQ-type POTRA domain-containing protein [Gemella cuniculi]